MKRSHLGEPGGLNRARYCLPVLRVLASLSSRLSNPPEGVRDLRVQGAVLETPLREADVFPRAQCSPVCKTRVQAGSFLGNQE